jgi:hypothetical protein
MTIEVRPTPTPEQQAAAEARIDWDKPIGNKPGSYGHALTIVTRPR